MNENRYLTYQFSRMLSLYKDYLRRSGEFLINENENIALHTNDIGILTLFIKEKNKEKGITTFNYKFIR